MNRISFGSALLRILASRPRLEHALVEIYRGKKHTSSQHPVAAVGAKAARGQERPVADAHFRVSEALTVDGLDNNVLLDAKGRQALPGFSRLAERLVHHIVYR